ncbi:hypothetical protein V5E97_24345 [Singulisphaera sp. Ch08]|uniref:YtkA-like domain-containing protein n=1 Tax=Singulisphaera sp. Ch08 TaxID=3120278 RepID=A0AAU7C8M1_9BACT
MFTGIAFAFALFAAANSSDDPKPSSSKPDSPAGNPSSKAETSAYRFEFERPTKAERSTQPGNQMPIAVALKVSTGNAPPTFMILQMLSGKTIVDSCAMNPKRNPSPGEQAFETNMKAPKQPGTYTLRVDAIQTTIYKNEKGKTATRDTHVISPSIKFIVKK